MSSLPSATILVLNYNGRQHLERCLPSLAVLDYPRVSVTVVDNGSSDGSREYVAREHPDVRVLPFERNYGFAPAYNRAVRLTPSDLIVLLNNDTHVAPHWLSALVDTLERHGAAAAASLMLDWQGRHVDFAGALPTFVGHAWQVDHGVRAEGRAYREQPLLFGCGGALAMRRQAFLEVGGFDDDYFAYFEDVDLGWRMSLAGLTTVLAPAAVTHHRLHGTAGGWGSTQRLRLYERNALYTIFKNYGDEALRRVLPAAIALTLGRALASEELDTSAIRFGHRGPERMPLPARVVASLLALEDFARALPRLQEKRRRVQSARRQTDRTLFTLFPQPLRLHEVGDSYREAALTLVRDFGIAELFDARVPAIVVERDGGVPSGSARRPGSPDRITNANPAPMVSVVVLTASGARHLPDCLDSLRAHSWPAAQTEVIVVDNGSPEDPTAAAERHYAGVRVLRLDANRGFSAGNNAGARAARGDWLVFLNDDTRVAPGWLHEMMRVARDRDAASVGAFIQDWSGERVDFAGGLVNCEGRGYSLGYDLPVADADRQERPLLFGCGAAVMFRRDVFEDAGGWDEPTFAYYEDVEFGWRLWMLGHEVWFAPKAIVYHRHHGTSGTESPARQRAFERNALRMLYSLLETSTLEQVLPAALLLSADRALLGTPFSRVDERVSAPRSVRALANRLQPRVATVRLLHALSQRGARRQYGTWSNLRRVGVSGLAGAVADLVRDVRDGWELSASRAAYLLEASAPNAALEGRHESVPAASVAQLAGLRDFIETLPELGRRRARLQARRRRSDAEIVSRFGGSWRNAVPSPHLARHLELRTALARTLSTVIGGLPDELALYRR